MVVNMKYIKRILHMALGYKVIITFSDGEEVKCRAYLSNDCTLRAIIYKDRQVRLKDNGVVRGMYKDDNTKWKTA